MNINVFPNIYKIKCLNLNSSHVWPVVYLYEQQYWLLRQYVTFYRSCYCNKLNSGAGTALYNRSPSALFIISSTFMALFCKGPRPRKVLLPGLIFCHQLRKELCTHKNIGDFPPVLRRAETNF